MIRWEAHAYLPLGAGGLVCVSGHLLQRKRAAITIRNR